MQIADVEEKQIKVSKALNDPILHNKPTDVIDKLAFKYNLSAEERPLYENTLIELDKKLSAEPLPFFTLTSKYDQPLHLEKEQNFLEECHPLFLNDFLTTCLNEISVF